MLDPTMLTGGPEKLRGVVLVTGSSSGIGEGIARQLAREGMTVVVNSRASRERGQRIAEDIGGSYTAADISDPSAIRSLIDSIIADHGQLDLLVNNAGTTEEIPHQNLEAANREAWRHIFETNVFGTWDLCVAARTGTS